MTIKNYLVKKLSGHTIPGSAPDVKGYGGQEGALEGVIYASGVCCRGFW
jgi:hypothetical protein